MHDIRFIRDNPDAFDAALKKRGLEPMAAALSERYEAVAAETQRMNELQSERNAASKQIGAAMGKGDKDEAERLKQQVADMKDDLARAEETQKALQAELNATLMTIPNLPADDVPEGADEDANVEIRKWGEPKEIAGAKEHFELGEALGQMDFETASLMSGSRFVILKKDLARLERALASFMLDLHTEEFGYEEVNPPVLVRAPALEGTSQLPKFEEDLFEVTSSFQRVLREKEYEDAARTELQSVLSETLPAIENLTQGLEELVDMFSEEELEKFDKLITGAEQLQDFRDRKLTTYSSSVTSFKEWVEELKLWNVAKKQELFAAAQERKFLTPTAEVTLTNLVREQIMGEEELPKRFTAWTQCFRSEAGSAGRDTKGMIRLHQFSKVELVSIVAPEKSGEEHERMTGAAEEVLKRLGLPFRTMVLCTGDMGFGAQKTYDIEVWLPGQGRYREISSCSNCGDFQARRMMARYRKEGDKRPNFVHTLNGSGLAVGRTLVAVLENYQQADGSISVPEALQPYMGGKTVIGG